MVPEPLPMTRAEVLAELADLTRDVPPGTPTVLTATAAAIAGWCVVEGGHAGDRALEPGDVCLLCGERREGGTEGGR